jgi:hypothetical protein
MLGDEMIFVLTTNQKDEAMVRIVVTEDTVLLRRQEEQSDGDYDYEITETKFGRLMLDVVNKKSNPKVKTE